MGASILCFLVGFCQFGLYMAVRSSVVRGVQGGSSETARQFLDLQPYVIWIRLAYWPLSWCLVAGLLHMAICQRRGMPIRWTGVFSQLRLYARLFPPAAVSCLFWTGITYLVILLIPRSDFLTVAIESLFAAPFMLSLPLLVDRESTLTNAGIDSARLLLPQYPRAVLFHLWAGIASSLGIFVACIGFVWSYPLMYIAIASLYMELMGLAAGCETPPTSAKESA